MVGGYEYHDQFTPMSCDNTINTTAMTAGAGSYVSDIYSHLDQHNLTVVDGMGPEVTMGGYLTGGGHSPISNIFGLGSDQVYEVEMVTPTGDIITANECQNTDLFWAVRGVSLSSLVDGKAPNILGWRKHLWCPDEGDCSDCSIHPNCSIRFYYRSTTKLYGLLE